MRLSGLKMESKTRKFDVIVVGGGSAGLSAAASAAKTGLKVAVLEKDPSIAGAIRTSGVTWLSDAEKLGVPSDFYHRIKKYAIYSPSKEYILETSKAEACTLDVRKLYLFIAHQAASLGAEIFLHTRVKGASYEKDKKGVEIIAGSSMGRLHFRGDIVIDASGFASIIGRTLGLSGKWRRFGVGAEYEAYAENTDAETWALMLGRKYSPAGYAWIFPVAENKVRIGVGVGRPESNVNPFEQLMYLLEKRPGPIKQLGRICPLEFHYGIVPSQGPRTVTVADCVLLVGDSAGHANPLLLEGIRFAIKFGRVAGEVAKSAIDQTDTSKLQLKKYEEKWKKEIWSNFRTGLHVQREWLRMTDAEWDREITILDSLSAKEVLEILKAEFSMRKLVKLVSKHPQLARSKFFSTIIHAKTRS